MQEHDIGQTPELAEQVGFEPTGTFAPPVLKAGALDLSAIAPNWRMGRGLNPRALSGLRYSRPLHYHSATHP